MSTEGGGVRFRFGADSGPVLNALQDIQNAGAKAGDRVALSVGRGSTALGAMAKAGAGAGGSMGKLGAAMGPLGGILARISPEAGVAAASIAGLTSASSTAAAGLGVSAGVMGVALGAVAAAALPFIGALVVMQREATEAAARTDFLAAHLHDLDAAHRALAASTLAAAVATGELSEAEAKAITLADQSTVAIEDFAKAQEKELAVLGEAYFAAERRKEQLSALPGFLSTAIDYYGGYTSTMQEASRALGDLARKEGEHTDIIMDNEEELQKAADATDKKAEADKAAAKALDRHREAMARLVDTQNLAYSQYKDHALTEQKIRADARAEVVADQMADEAAMKAGDEAWMKRMDLMAAQSEKSREESRTAAAQMQDASLGAASSSAQAVFGLVDQLNQQAMASHDTTTKAGREAAHRQFLSNKAASVGMAAVLAAVAIAQAVASAPPPLNIPAIVANSIAGAAQVAAVAAVPEPKFHMGTNEVKATLTKDEAVLTGAAADQLGRGRINDLNAGKGGAPQSVTVVQAVDHRVFHRTVRDNLALNGPLYKATSAASGVPVGHRSSR